MVRQCALTFPPELAGNVYTHAEITVEEEQQRPGGVLGIVGWQRQPVQGRETADRQCGVDARAGRAERGRAELAACAADVGGRHGSHEHHRVGGAA